MRTFSLLLLCVLGLSSLAFSQNTPDPKNASPCFHVVGPMEQFVGAIPQTGTAKHSFTFRNDCTETVEIESAKASCGCTATVISTHTIEPGKEGQIEIQFTPLKGWKGRYTKSVAVYLKGKSEPSTTVRFTVDVVSEIIASPNLITIDSAWVGVENVVHATVKNTSDHDVEILAEAQPFTLYPMADAKTVDYSQSYISHTIHVMPAKARIPAGGSIQIAVEVAPDTPGKLTGSITVTTDKSNIAFQVTADVRVKPKETHPPKKGK